MGRRAKASALVPTELGLREKVLVVAAAAKRCSDRVSLPYLQHAVEREFASATPLDPERIAGELRCRIATYRNAVDDYLGVLEVLAELLEGRA